MPTMQRQIGRGGGWIVVGMGILGLGSYLVGWGWQGWAASEAVPPTAPADVHVLIVYYTLGGTTEKMAAAVAEGARSVAGVTVKVKKVEEVTKQELIEADGLILGCPTYFANIPGKMKVLMDDWNWKWKVDFTDKVGGAFATGGGLTGGKEFVITSLLLFMINHRMIVAGPLYEDQQGEDKWGELGASAATGPLDPGLSEAELFTARRLGQRIAQLAKKFHQTP
ncbi:MAG: NAD(P)H-dependent oxidoreductase [Thermoguttaceae bacterium]|nr:NAD(P)H-dependent oxidoreductase [Thermoguttaceae bacterium]MDW8039088.1 NAD(P)H-dependent oxidoreductase [Thermoguttaceae bacterium]